MTFYKLQHRDQARMMVQWRCLMRKCGTAAFDSLTGAEVLRNMRLSFEFDSFQARFILIISSAA